MENVKPPLLSPLPSQGRSSLRERVAGVAPPPLVPGESKDKYANLVSDVVAAAKPQDAIEEILIRDFIHATWEIHRLRRFSAAILKASANEGMQTVLNRLGYHSIDLSKKCAAGDKSAKREVERARHNGTISRRGDGDDVRAQD